MGTDRTRAGVGNDGRGDGYLAFQDSCYLQALIGIFLAQELLALRLALEEGGGPGPGPPRELSFTKSSQAVRAVRDILVSACASQWEQLRGLGSDEDGLQKVGSEGEYTPKMTHLTQIDLTGPQIWCPSRNGGGKVSGTRGGAVILPRVRGDSCSSPTNFREIKVLHVRFVPLATFLRRKLKSDGHEILPKV